MGTLIGSAFRNALCADLNGTDEYMSRTGTLSFRSDTAGAWSMWVRIDNTFASDNSRMAWGFGTSGTNRFSFGVRRITATGTGTFFTFATVVGGVTRGYSATTTALAANTWYHVVFQSSGTAYSCSVNGTSQTITQWAGAVANTGDWFGDHTGTAPWFTVGVQNGPTSALGTNFLEGRLDEFLYLPGRVFTAGEITEIYNGGVRKNPHRFSMISSLTTWYRMGDSRDSATTVFDEVGGNDMTLVNMDASNYVAV